MDYARVSQSRPQALPEGAEQSARGSAYGDMYACNIVNTKHLLNMEGSYMITQNPTPGTAVQLGAATAYITFADTVVPLMFRNNSTSAAPVMCCLDYLKIFIGGTAPASATDFRYAFKIDTANRTPSANTNLATSVNANLRNGMIPMGQLYYSGSTAQTVPASSAAAKLLGAGMLRSSISVIRDMYEFRFGGVDGVSGNAAGIATVPTQVIANVAPIVVGPQESLAIHLWQPSGATNALSIEFEMGWWERL